MTSIPFVKGHGTGNDFVLIADPDGEVDLDAAEVAAIAHRRFGVGADGLIRAVRSARVAEGAALLAEDPGAEWFMDYRNADGSIAETCGNGIRVFTAFLIDQGLIELDEGQSVTIGTRVGARRVTRLDEDDYEVDLGPWRIADGEVRVEAPGLHIARPGLALAIGNPHVVVALSDAVELDALELDEAPSLTPAPPRGANVEFVVPLDPVIVDGMGRIRMRVHERGSGETLSCGSGAAAAALATRHWAGGGAPDRWSVAVLGGELGVRVADISGEQHVLLSGPAELVFDGVLEL